MHTILIEEVKKNRTPSVQYAIFDTERIIRRYTYGYADFENKKEATENTTYNAYSVTKTFTALAILQLAEQNKLRLDGALREYLPDIPYGPEITVKQVLSHSAGIPNPIPLNWIHLKNDHKTFDRNKFFMDIINKNNKVRSNPNEKFAYSNLGYVILGQLIEKISGVTYEDYIQDNIIKKLRIPVNDIGFEINDTTRHATGYHKKISFSNLLLGFLIDKSKYMSGTGNKWTSFKSFYVNGTSYGGLIGAPDAFIRYIRELLTPDNNLITKDSWNNLFTENFTAGNKPTGMCLSWFKGQLKGNVYFTHAGGGGGYYCEIRIYPDLGLGSVIFFNRTGMTDERFLDKVDKLYFENR